MSASPQDNTISFRRPNANSKRPEVREKAKLWADVWDKYVEAGYEPRQIIEELMANCAGTPQPRDQMSTVTLNSLTRVVERLEDLIGSARSGQLVFASPEHAQQFENAAANLTDDFLSNIQESFEPGFTGFDE